jgi:translocation and assembly module TamB
VRLKSSSANVQLAGTLEIAGQVNNPYILGEVDASRGTYRIDLGMLKRTFRVDSGTVRVAGTKDQAASLDIYASYVVRGNENDASRDVRIDAHLTGSSTAPQLELSSDLGSGVGQSELISYLIFGSPSFMLDGQGSSTVKSATAALVPSLGGLLEGVLGTMLPFFNSLQVTTVAGNGPQNLVASPLDGVLNSFAITGGRQVGADGFLNISGGRCGGSRLASTQSPSGWAGVSMEYRPRLGIGAIASIDPGPSPCNSVGALSRVYQVGLDVFREFRWK